jgi:hypothetical protein
MNIVYVTVVYGEDLETGGRAPDDLAVNVFDTREDAEAYARLTPCAGSVFQCPVVPA